MDRYYISILGRKIEGTQTKEIHYQNIVNAKSIESATNYVTNDFVNKNPLFEITSILISEESKLSDFTVPGDV